MSFPSWVNKYKEKGTSIRKAGNKYYKYRVHSERRPDKAYPVLVQDEFLGTIDESGFKPASKRMIDIANTEVISLYDLANHGLFIEEYGYDEIKILKTIYLLVVDDKYYFTKLNNIQKELLDEHKVDYTNGSFN